MSEYQQSIVAKWSEVLLASIRSGPALPTETTYQLFLTHTAIYDAWAAYDTDASTFHTGVERPRSEHTDANKTEAVSHAAYQALVTFFPHRKPIFDAFMDELGFDPGSTSTDPKTAAGMGNLAARAVFDARAGDGSNFENGYADTSGYAPVNSPVPGAPNARGGPDFDPNSWQPLRVPTGTVTDGSGNPVFDNDDPDSFVDQVALAPHWGSVTPAAMPSGDAARPPAPPRLGDFGEYVDANGKVSTGDAAYREQFAEVVTYSADLTAREKVIAEYWADGPRTESPPGHSNVFAADAAAKYGHGIDEDAKMYMALNMAIFDAGIAAWEAKYAYDYIRPQTAIRHLFEGEEIEAWAGPGLGTRTIDGETWQPYQKLSFITPPFPEYVSGHSAFTAAASATLTAFLGSDEFYDGVTLSLYDLDDVPGRDLMGQYVATELLFEEHDGSPVTLRWETFGDAAAEAGISRLHGGIHIRDGDLRGREVGAEVAEIAEARWAALFSNGGDDDLRAERDGGHVFAGAGDDLVRGRQGDDFVFAGTGRDTVFGGAGDDAVYGEAENDLIDGGSGDDLLSGGGGNDEVFGRGGADTLLGGDGRDALHGGGGRDVIAGGDGRDFLKGGGGRDVIAGGDGRDFLEGGGGRDSFVIFKGESGTDTITDYGRGRDTLVLVGYGDGEDAVVSLKSRVGGDMEVRVDGDRVAVLANTDTEDLDLQFQHAFDLV
jgi:hypothetical protein